jgi:hypothetical protein
MSQSQTLTATKSKGNNFTYVATVTKNTNDIESLIQKHNLNESMDRKQVINAILNDVINDWLADAIQHKAITVMSNGNYLIGNKIVEKKDILTVVKKAYHNKIQEYLNRKIEIIQSYLKTYKLQGEKVEIEGKITVKQNLTQTLTKEQENCVNKIKELNTELREGYYKQNKVVGQVNRDLNQLLFQGQNIGLKGKQLEGQLEAQKSTIMGQNIAREGQIQQLEATRAENERRLNELASRNANEEANRALQEYLTDKQIQVANQNTDKQILAANQNTDKQILAANQNTDKQIQVANTNAEADRNLQKEIANMTFMDNQKTRDVMTSGNQAIIDTMVQGVNYSTSIQSAGFQQLVNGLNNLGANIAQANNLQSQFTGQLINANNQLNNLGNMFPPTPGVPPGCDPAILTRLRCSGAYWNMTPEITNAINMTTGQTGINIFRCSAGGHFCASDGEYGDWDRRFIRSGVPPPGYSR